MATADVVLPVPPVIGTIPKRNVAVPEIRTQAIPSKQEFDPAIHLDFQPPPKIWTMKDFGLQGYGLSPVAVSEPFPLFTPEAVRRMREEAFSPEVVEKCQYSSDLAQCQLRGYANKYAPFVYDTWKSPETLKIISSIAGLDLVPMMDFEIGHLNVSIKTEQQLSKELQAYNGQFSESGPDSDEQPLVAWHKDSYPFVCVTMLSDCTSMIGGETAVRMGNGEIKKVRGPQMGSAVVLQGRYIEHQALRAFGSPERISMVTAFRPRNPHLPDDSALTNVRPISNLFEIYYEFSEYRLEALEERIRKQLKDLRESNRGGKRLAVTKLKTFLREQQQFLEATHRELITGDNEEDDMNSTKV